MQLPLECQGGQDQKGISAAKDQKQELEFLVGRVDALRDETSSHDASEETL
jgi:hypothetical protein